MSDPALFRPAGGQPSDGSERAVANALLVIPAQRGTTGRWPSRPRDDRPVVVPGVPIRELRGVRRTPAGGLPAGEPRRPPAR